MQNMIYPSIITDNSVLIVKNGNRLLANRGHINFNKIVDRIRKNNFNNIEQLFKIKESVEKMFNVTVKNGNQVYYKGKKLHNAVTERILKSMRDNLPYKQWICFLDKLMQNPDEYCRNQLFSYVENYGLPIDSNGFIYAWKTVRNDYWDKWTGKTHQYKVGKLIKMDRKKCKTHATIACGDGLHCGETSYVIRYANESAGDRYMLVRFSPKDVMSCPSDCDWKKLRLCKLRVMREVKREDVLPLGDSYMGKNGRLPKRNSLGQFC